MKTACCQSPRAKTLSSARRGGRAIVTAHMHERTRQRLGGQDENEQQQYETTQHAGDRGRY